MATRTRSATRAIDFQAVIQTTQTSTSLVVVVVVVAHSQPPCTVFALMHAVERLYTVSHKKRATLFLIITLVFLGRFLYFLDQWEDEGILYTGVNKIYHFTLNVSPHYT